jgi:GNAT superfamily N-acetyltransferase
MPDQLELHPTPYDHPDAVALTALAQDFYIDIYGGPDDTPFTAEEFSPPHGGFLIGYVGARPVNMGGWRWSPYANTIGAERAAEIKRMFTHPDVRGHGYAHALLEALEANALAAGADWMVLETGRPQTAAIAFYRANGYVDIAPFGFYADSPNVVSLGKRLLHKS